MNDGIQCPLTQLSAEHLVWLKYCAIPLIGALIGWLTNALAVRMIFRPHRLFKLGPLRFQGLVPKRQPQIAASIGHTVEKHLLSHADVQRALTGPGVHAQIEALVGERVARFLDEKLLTINPMVGMFLVGDLRLKVQGILTQEACEWIPSLTEQMLGQLEEQLNFQQIVEEKVRGFDLVRLEQIILEIASRELKAIEVWGGVIGFVIGLVQVGIMMI